MKVFCRNINNKPLILVTHVPKCCGTSLRYCIAEGLNIAEESFYWPKKIRPGKGLSGIFWGHPNNFEYLVGHFPWGVQWLFRPWSEVGLRPKIHIATLRDPIDQMISFYHYHIQLGNNSPHKRIISETSNIVDFYIADKAFQNLQTKMYVGLPYSRFWNQAKKLLGHKVLVEKGLKNLTSNYSFWVHHGYLDASIQHLGKGLGVPLKIGQADLTVTRDRPALNDVSESMIQELRVINSLDIDLHHALSPYMERFCGVKETL